MSPWYTQYLDDYFRRRNDMVELTLRRNPQTDSTPGELYFDGRVCSTLEPISRALQQSMDEHTIAAIKVFGKTAIPIGRYKIEAQYWSRKKEWVPHLLDVPGFEGIFIHSGETTADSEGCILITNINDNHLLREYIFDTLASKEQVYITIAES